MPGQTNEFLSKIGNELAARLQGGFEYSKSSRRLRRASSDGLDIISFAGSSKYSPHLSISFYFGRNFDSIRSMEKALKWQDMPFHIQQYSAGMRQMAGLDYTGPTDWSVNLRDDDAPLIEGLSGAIEAVAYPFFERFRDIRTARDAFANGDTWCFSQNYCWHQLLKMDAALGELDHFREWSARLDPLQLEQAGVMLKEVKKSS